MLSAPCQHSSEGKLQALSENALCTLIRWTDDDWSRTPSSLGTEDFSSVSCRPRTGSLMPADTHCRAGDIVNGAQALVTSIGLSGLRRATRSLSCPLAPSHELLSVPGEPSAFPCGRCRSFWSRMLAGISSLEPAFPACEGWGNLLLQSSQPLPFLFRQQ